MEKHIYDLQANRERAEQLAYALEEELKKWKEQLEFYDERLKCLAGDCILGGMIIAYGGQFEFKERENAVSSWREICEKYRIPISDLSILKIFEPILNSTYLRADTLPAFPFYQENCLIVQKSKKWILFEDPDNLARLWIHQAEGTNNYVQVDLHQANLVQKLKLALNKGTIFLIDNFNKDYPPEIDKLIQYEIYERLRVFVGLIGIPEKKKELKVLIGSSEITVHPRFKLYLRSESVENRKELQEFLKIVNFKMSSELFKGHLLKALIRQDNPQLEEKRLILRANQFQRKDKVEEEKDNILKLLYKAQGALLEDEDLISNITDAKASVVTAMNAQREADEAREKLEVERVKYLQLINPISEVYKITEILRDIDPMYFFSTGDFMKILQDSWAEASKEFKTIEERVKTCLHNILNQLCVLITNGLHTSHRMIFLLMFIVYAMHSDAPDEEKGEFKMVLNNFFEAFDAGAVSEDEVLKADDSFKVLGSVRLNIFLKAILIKYNKGQGVHSAFVTYIESELRRFNIHLNVEGLTMRVSIYKDTAKPLLIVEHGSLDTWWMIAKLGAKKNVKKPRLLVLGSHLDYDEISKTIEDCKESKTILIMQGLQNQISHIIKLKIPPTDDEFMIYATVPKVNFFIYYNCIKFVSVAFIIKFPRKKLHFFHLHFMQLFSSDATMFLKKNFKIFLPIIFFEK